MKLKEFFCGAIALIGLGLAFVPGNSTAQESKKLVFAVVPKSTSNPFYDDVRDGSTAQANELQAELRWVGPETTDADAQVKILADLVHEGVNGIAVAPVNAESVISVIGQARIKSIPVITFDSDSPRSDRVAYIGTNNRAAGREAGKAFHRLLPRGKFAILTGGNAAQNLNERIAGFREFVTPQDYIEIAGSPFPCDDDPQKANQIVSDVLARHPDLNGFFFSGGWPMFLPDDYIKALGSRAADVKSGKLVIVSFDKLPTQLRILNAGYASALIGQRGWEMGSKSIAMLNDVLRGKKVTNIETGVDVVERSDVSASNQ